MSGLIGAGKDRPDKDSDVVILTKFIVSPDKAEDFVTAIKKVSSVIRNMLVRISCLGALHI